MNKLTWWHVVGAYLGYPDCCIEAFIFRIEFAKSTGLLKVLDKDQEFYASLYTGFIPCPDCATKLRLRGLPLSTLIRDRICPIEFPSDDLHLIHSKP